MGEVVEFTLAFAHLSLHIGESADQVACLAHHGGAGKHAQRIVGMCLKAVAEIANGAQYQPVETQVPGDPEKQQQCQ